MKKMKKVADKAQEPDFKNLALDKVGVEAINQYLNVIAEAEKLGAVDWKGAFKGLVSTLQNNLKPIEDEKI